MSASTDNVKSMLQKRNIKESESRTADTPQPIDPETPKKHNLHALRPLWEDDSNISECFICNRGFTIIRRKHHCRACGRITCNDCSLKKISLTKLGYMDYQRVCNKCYEEIEKSRPKKQRSASLRNNSFEIQKPPVQRSSSVLFSPPMSPIAQKYEEEIEEETEISGNTLHYFDFDILVDKKIYSGIQVSVSTDRVFITAFDTSPPFRTLFYRDILTVKKSDSPGAFTDIYWFPWVGSEDNRTRKETKVVTRHSSIAARNKFFRTITDFMRISSSLSTKQQRIRNGRKLLVLINPKSGSGKALKIFNENSRLFDLCGIEYDTIYMNDTQHTRTILENGDITPYFAIICCGGDGVMHFALGILTERRIDIPVFSIPAGHGVGISASILGHAYPELASFSIAKGFRRKLDLVEVHQDHQLMCHGCLFVAWGAVAEVEFNTDYLRWLGPVRYRMGALLSISVGASALFHLRISYLPSPDQEMKFCTGEGCLRCLQGIEEEKDRVKRGELLNRRTEEWVVIEGHFMLVTAMNLSDTTEGHRFAPYAHPSDGCFDLGIVREVSRADLIELYATLKTGSFVDKTNFNRKLSENLTYVKVVAFKVQYLDQGPLSYSVDGMQYTQTSEIECTVIPSACTLGS